MGASVRLIAQNGTFTGGETGPDGIAQVPAAVRRKVAVFIAHPQYRAGYYRQHDTGSELCATLPQSAGVQSAIGRIPGFAPIIEPIGDNHDAEGIPRRTYMYITNGSLNGSASQPAFFTVGVPMMLEDSNGKQVRATCVGFVGRSTLWEYEYPEKRPARTDGTTSGETVVLTGQICPESGTWKSLDNHSTTAPIAKGNRMPPHNGKSVDWQLLERA